MKGVMEYEVISRELGSALLPLSRSLTHYTLNDKVCFREQLKLQDGAAAGDEQVRTGTRRKVCRWRAHPPEERQR